MKYVLSMDYFQELKFFLAFFTNKNFKKEKKADIEKS